jgi:hypothetical protein
MAGHGDRDRLLCRGMSHTAKQQWRFASGSNTGAAASDSIRS